MYMTINHTEALLNSIKKVGMKVEKELNDSIQNSLNKEDVLKDMLTRSEVIAAAMKKLQHAIETLSIPLNFPTKTDVANAAKLTVQAEEKMDLIDEKVMALAQSMEELKRSLAASSSNSKSEPNEILKALSDLKQTLDQELESSSSSESADQ
jgi:organic radical activating enzyme